MYSLIYMSAADETLTEEDLSAIWRVSKQKNHAVGITGLLLYGRGVFLQVLEGPEEDITQLVKRIETDPRHCDITILGQQDISRRSFGDWAMAYKTLDDHQTSLLSETLGWDWVPAKLDSLKSPSNPALLMRNMQSILLDSSL
ncbi:BLUF domain-containing protein [Eilatimonas milleporae]|uniref:FAD-dependent sensor of blue light n=1 Tax=Eilatimonas milleporae TaxID=911205 RepID=A0A3M0BY05_9PROT|nr:BLUF domain-containing protein [Eilatimonas milleporae]RMB01445.1 FAD-dependent sensor of blue light [Eilatimonas milleporae]